MNARERFYGCVRRQGYDRIPVRHQYGTPEFHQRLYGRYGIDQEIWTQACGEVYRAVGPRYCGPNHEDRLKGCPPGSSVGCFGEIYAPWAYGSGEFTGHYPEAAYLPFAEITDVKQLEGYSWPSPDWYDYSAIKERCQALRSQGFVVVYPAWSYDFMNCTARTRGVTQTMLDIGLRDPVFLELIERRFQFEYEKDRRVLEAAGGLIDVMHFCEDLGGQNGPLISRRTFDDLFAPYFQRGLAEAHAHGALTQMHVCGGVRPLIPHLIEIGLDILDVVQVSAEGMDIEGLKEDFGDSLVFAGSMCVQTFLGFGTPEGVRREVEKRLALFAEGGLILGPSHDIQVHTPVENVIEMYRAAGTLDELLLQGARSSA